MSLRNISDQLLHDLGKAIVQGELQEGSTLPKVEDLSEMKGVSRTVVREAFKGLSARRLIESTSKVGTVVCRRVNWQWWDPNVLTWAIERKDNHSFMHQLTEVRLALEPAAVELAAKNATESDIANIKEHYEQMERSIHDETEWVKADYALHQSILAASHNELILSLIQTLRLVLEASRYNTIHVLKRKSLEPLKEVLFLHKAVVDAVIIRDGALARQKMQELLLRVAELIDEK